MSEIPPDGERMEATDTVTEYLRKLYRDGSADVRIVFSNVPREEWDEIDGHMIRRFPEGAVKVSTLAIGLTVEWVADPEDRAA